MQLASSRRVVIWFFVWESKGDVYLAAIACGPRGAGAFSGQQFAIVRREDPSLCGHAAANDAEISVDRSTRNCLIVLSGGTDMGASTRDVGLDM
jgi:hypothetical protein